MITASPQVWVFTNGGSLRLLSPEPGDIYLILENLLAGTIGEDLQPNRLVEAVGSQATLVLEDLFVWPGGR